MRRPQERVAGLRQHRGVAAIDDPVLQRIHQRFGAHQAVAAPLRPARSADAAAPARVPPLDGPKLGEHRAQRGADVADDGERGRGAEGDARHVGIDVDVNEPFGRDEAAVPERGRFAQPRAEHQDASRLATPRGSASPTRVRPDRSRRRTAGRPRGRSPCRAASTSPVPACGARASRPRRRHRVRRSRPRSQTGRRAAHRCRRRPGRAVVSPRTPDPTDDGRVRFGRRCALHGGVERQVSNEPAAATETGCERPLDRDELRRDRRQRRRSETAARPRTATAAACSREVS